MPTNEHTETVTQENVAMVATTLSVPEAIWKGAKNLATERRTSAQSIWIVAMTKYLKRYGSEATKEAINDYQDRTGLGDGN